MLRYAGDVGCLADLSSLREFLKWQTEKMWEKRIVCARGVSAGVLIVLPSSCSITPPSGEGDSLQQMVGGIQWCGQDFPDYTIVFYMNL